MSEGCYETLVEAARRVAFFDGPTPENLAALRAAMSDVDEYEARNFGEDFGEDQEEAEEGSHS